PSGGVRAVWSVRRGQLARGIPEGGDGLGWGLSPMNADDLSFLNTIVGEGEVSVRIQHPDGSESEIQETIFCGLWRVRHLHNRRLLTDRLEEGSAPLKLWQAATDDTLSDNSRLPPAFAWLDEWPPRAHALLADVRETGLT
ncbi:hydrogenase expression/formation C-terminal domain-containing protein, partial [Salmonella enterica]|uniref:hydrogenase expression/formation C-terminal domain-containing protein n=1 Tax=Salmonella enterica TaxID=28901 RepID=UPI00398C6BC5